MRLLMVLIILNLLGCATITSQSLKAESSNIKVYNSDLQTVWNKVLDIIQASKVPIQTINKDKGIIICYRLRIDLDEFKRIGSLPSRGEAGGFKQPWLWARYRQQYQAQAISANQTKVTINIHLEGYNASGARWITIISNGTEEKEILDELQSRLNSKDN